MNEPPCETCISYAICHMRYVFKCIILTNWMLPPNPGKQEFKDRFDLYANHPVKLDQIESLFRKKVFGVNPFTKTVILMNREVLDRHVVNTEMVEDL